MVLTIEEFGEKTVDQKRRVNRAELEKLIQSQLDLMANDPTEIRNIITNTINSAIDKTFEQFSTEMKQGYQKLKVENDTLRKAITEQQKFLENLHREKVRNHIFMSGIPNELNIDGHIVAEPNVIINTIISKVSADVSEEDYVVAKSFNCRDGQNKHSAKIVFKNTVTKGHIMANSKILNSLNASDPLRKVFIKHEASLFHRKENDRIYSKYKKLKDEHPGREYKLSKGILYEDNEQIDEFNISNSIFMQDQIITIIQAKNLTYCGGM